jgi:hypothetical protein
MSVKNFNKVQAEFRESETRLGKLVEELGDYRRRAKADNFRDQELVKQGEQCFDAAKTEMEKAQKLFAKLQELHEEFWRGELSRSLDEASAALAPLARAHRIAVQAFGACGHFPAWLAGKFDTGLLAEAEATAAKEPTAIPVEKPKSFTLDLADEEVW